MTRFDDPAMTRRRFQAGVAGLAGASLAGCVEALGLGEDTVSFENITETIGFDYHGQEGGIGFGNSGLYVCDYDNDQLPEILAIGGAQPVLFDNEDGRFVATDILDGRFSDTTVQAAVFFDHNRNGWEDLLVFEKHGPAHFFENIEGEFEPRQLGFETDFIVPTSVAVADASGNGYLDVFVAQMNDWAHGVPRGWAKEELEEPLEDDNGAPNLLFWNDNGTFSLDETSGISGDRWSLATSFVDLTGDGRQDIHVANDFNRDVIYLNRGDRTFEQVLLGEETDRNGMSSLITDVTGNGRPDIFVTNIYFPLDDLDEEELYDRVRRHFEFVLQSPRIEGNNLIVNDGDGAFSYQADTLGLAAGGWGWAAVAIDFDHDGQEEIFHATQNIIEVYDPPVYTYPMYFKRAGERYERQDARELGFAAGNDRAVVALDLGMTGAMDLAIGSYNAPFRVYHNHAAAGGGQSIQLDLRDQRGSIAIGSTVRVQTDEREQYRFLTSGSDYQSQSTRILHVGLGDVDTIDILEISWPNGATSTHQELEADQRLVISPDGIEERVPYSS